ncbi:MAG: hypothetical protein DMF88_01515 [Acidobacteria bacterium]|nr:MAG: hypothetical protein DMF88_01515 [Acidobacteriota bacterium]
MVYAFRALVVAALCLGCATVAHTQTLLESSAEARFQLDFHVPDAALMAMLPPGFTLNVATQGAAKDANVRVIFVDRMTVNGPDGKPIGKGSSRLVYLASPVKDPSGANAQVVIGGITDNPADVPGPFGNYLLATTHRMHRSTSSDGKGPVLDSQDWVFQAAGGEHLELHIKYEHGVGNRGNAADVKFYSAKNPGVAQISKQEQVLDILRNVTTTPPDRVKEFSFKGSGGSYAKLFDGTERVLSWDNLVWINRSVSQP